MLLKAGELWRADEADCLEWLAGFPDGYFDLVCGSPPYELARLYLEGGKQLGIARKTDEWVRWMVEVFQASQRACKGLVAMVVAGQTRKYRWSAGPALLMAELHRAGMNLRNPPIFSRVGIPGSGGPDWLRADYEWIICTTRPGRLPWSDNTACGHPPKWAPGGEMSHRLSDGQRVNGADDPWMQRDRGNNIGGRRGDGSVKQGTTHKPPSGRGRKRDGTPKQRRNFRHNEDGTVKGGHARDIVGQPEEFMGYQPPAKANPGNEVQQKYEYTAKELQELLGGGDITRHIVGGGVMGHELAHQNEAPFPLSLASFVVQSFCRPGGIVADPFLGSGTTLHAAVEHGRRGIGCDLRKSQVELSRRRLSGVTPSFV